MNYDIVIIGSGVAGLTSGIYASRANKSVLIIEDNFLGGTTATLEKIDNYPAVLNASGIELVQNMYMQNINFGTEFDFSSINSLDFDKNVIVTDNNSYHYKALIIATGSSPNRLKVTNEKDFRAKGLSYCAICDGNLYKDKKVIVVTSNNSAKHTIDYLSNLTKDLVVVDIENGYKNSELKVYNNIIPQRIDGATKVNSLVFVYQGKNQKVDCDGIFVDLGKSTNIDLFKNKLTTEQGFICSDESMRTNIENVFVAGDVRKKSLRQIVTACSDGAIASTQAIKFLNSKK